MRPSNHLAIVTGLLAACCCISEIRAEVYRCVGDNGHISYQQIRCHQNSKPLAINHSRTGWTGLRGGEKALLSEYQKRVAGHRQQSRSNTSQADSETKACWSRETQLDEVKAKLRRGYNIKEGDRLHQQRSEHEDYLRQFCSR